LLILYFYAGTEIGALSQLKQELLQMIAKYTKVDEDKINSQVESDNNISVLLELGIVLHDCNR